MRRALIIGIDQYDKVSRLHGCVRDATEMAMCLSRHSDGSPNFDVRLATSADDRVDTDFLYSAVDELFSAKADVALFYFAGHGSLNKTGNLHLVSQSATPNAPGLSMVDLMARINKSKGMVQSTIVILDSCHSGAAGEVAGVIEDEVSAVGSGLIILSASHKSGYAEENNGRGVFTDIMLDGLQGSASDILGNITPAALYALVDQVLGSWDQRPIFKANVENFITLRSVEPKVDPKILRRLPEHFPEANSILPLDPQYEPDRRNVPEEFRDLPIDDDKVRVFKELQNCNRYGLVVPVGAEHMYDAAIGSTGCRLTALGAHYRLLAVKGRI